MRKAIVVGAGAGLVGGIVAAIVLSILGVKGPHGEVVGAITVLSRAVGSDRLVAGWLVDLAATVVLGALFGVVYGMAGARRESASWWAVAYGLVCWIVGWFVVLPSPLHDAPRAAATDPTLFQLAVAGLVASFGFAAVLAGAFTLFGRSRSGGPSGSRHASNGHRHHAGALKR